MADGLDLGTLKIKIKADGAKQTQKELNDVAYATSNAEQKSQGTQSSMKGLGSAFMDAVKNTKVFGISIGDVVSGMDGATLASGVLGGAIGALVTMGVQVAIQAFTQLIAKMGEFVKQTFEVGVAFQAQMSKVAALSGATNKEFEQLVKGARKFGAETVFSATEAAQALEYTSLAGWNVQESMDGLPGILNLAASASMDLGKASDIVTDYLTAFGMEVKESTRLADVMAYAMSNSNTNVEQLGEAYKHSASTAHAFGLSVEEATGWLSKMADAGKKGGEAGTALNAVLARLYGQNKTATDAMTAYGLSMYEANGQAKSFTQVMGEMQKAMEHMTDAKKNSFLRDVAGTNQLAAFTTMLASSADEVAHFTNELENASGTSERMAKTMTDNIDGLQKSIGSKFESIQLSIFNIFEPIASGVLKVVDSIMYLGDKLWGSFSGIFSKITGLITPFVDVVTTTFNTLVDIIYPIVEPIFLLLETGFGKNMESLKMWGNVFIGVLGEIKNAIMPFVDFFNNTLMVVVDLLAGNWESAMNRMENAGVIATQAIINTFLLIPNAIIAVVNAVVEGINTMFNTCIKKMDYVRVDLNKFLGQSKDGMEEMAEGTDKAFSSAADSVSDNVKEMDEAVNGALDKTSKMLDDFYGKQLSKYEKELRDQIGGEITLADEKWIQRKLAKEEARLEKQKEKELEKERQSLEMQERMYEASLKKREEMYKKSSANGSQGSLYQNNYSRSTERYANGTSNARGGLSVVGEVGRELMYIPPQAQIVNNNTTEKILSGKSGPTFTGPIYVQANNVQELIDELKMATISGEFA